MSAKRSNENFDPLAIGQFVRITKDRLISGLPVLDAKSWVQDVTEGAINNLKRIDGGVMATISRPENGPSEFFIGISPLGPLLNHNGFRLEILNREPVQHSLLSAKGGAA